MGALGWRSGRPLSEWLRQEAHRFDFFQAVRLLERLRPNSIPLGEGSDPRREAVRLRSGLDLTFPASPVHALNSGDKPLSTAGPLPELTANFMGIGGFVGPLPVPFSELILARLRERDTGPRDFLDLFNHRVLSIAYRIRRHHRVGYERGNPEQHRFADALFALMGLGMSGDALRDRQRVPDRAYLRYAGLLAQRPRSLSGLSAMLSDHLRAPVRVDPWRGAFRPLDDDQHTRIGVLGATNNALGHNVVLGTSVWDSHAGVTVRVGPVGYQKYHEFLPGAAGLQALSQLTRFYSGPQLDFTVRVRVRGSEVRPAGLSAGAPLPKSSQSTILSSDQKGPRCLLGCCVGGACVAVTVQAGSWLRRSAGMFGLSVES